MNERLPDFLIVGAMKSGTTSLYNDLKAQPNVFFPNRKEPHDLLYPTVLQSHGRSRYSRLFRRCPADSICGEASTHYTALPTSEGTAERARQLLGRNTKILYIVRNPVDRTISHFHHGYAKGQFELPMEDAFRKDRRLITISQYAMQIEPWVESFGWENILVIIFEDYVRDRGRFILELAPFLGFEASTKLLETEKAFNKGEGNRLWPRSFDCLRNSSIARSLLDPVMSPRLRDLARSLLAPKPRPRPGPPAATVIDCIINNVESDIDRFAKLLDRSSAIWDWEATRNRYALMLSGSNDSNLTGDCAPEVT